jgi:hypothetical protein
MKNFVGLIVGLALCGGCYVPAPHVGISEPITINFESTGTCVAGERFKVECNWCTCPANGLKQDASCTKMACLAPPVLVRCPLGLDCED